ncbi:MAG: tyrosine-type recombinase/integrase [Promethearchaeota archaeon]
MVVRHCAGRCWNELDEEDAREIANLPLSKGARAKRLTVLGQVVAYLREELGVDTVLLDRADARLARQVRPVNLIGQPDVARLLAHLAAQEETARTVGRADAARRFHNAYLTVLLAYFWGLRRTEVPHLQLGNLVIDAQQSYVRVRNSKGGRSRVVWARHVPPAVLDWLRAKWQHRWTVVSGDLGAHFLDYEGAEDAAAEALGKVVNQAIRDLELPEAEGALPITLHTLRHAYANRLLMLGVPLVDITRSLGHADPDVTCASYLHAFDWLQRERLAEVEAARPRGGLTAPQIGVLLGIQRPAVLAALGKLPSDAVEDWWEGSRHVYSWGTVVRLVAGRMKMEE